MVQTITNPPDDYVVHVGDRVAVVVRAEYAWNETEPNPQLAAQHVAGQVVAAFFDAGWKIELVDVFGRIFRDATLYQVQEYAIAWRILEIPPDADPGLPAIDFEDLPSQEPEVLEAGAGRAFFGGVALLMGLAIGLALASAQLVRSTVIPEGTRTVFEPASKIVTAAAVILVALVVWRLAS